MSGTVTAHNQQASTTTATYRAAVVNDFGAPLIVGLVPMRPLEPGQVRVKIEASGLCHTDIHAAHCDWPVKPAPPFVPGHEGVGIVTELGPGVSEVAVGDRQRRFDEAVDLYQSLCARSNPLGLLPE
jgi:Zn-dependent alcohol dehydrogenase